MEPSCPDYLRGPRLAFLAASALLCLQPAWTADNKREPIVLADKPDANLGMKINFSKGTAALERLELSQGSTLLKASRAEATGMVDGKYEDSTWVLTDAVHMAFDGAVLDTRSATVTFADGYLKSVQVQDAVHLEVNGTLLDAHTALVTFVDNRVRTVHAEGAPAAQFSRQLKDSHRASGQAARIDYDAGKNHIRISGGAEFIRGNSKYRTEDGIYNLTDDSFIATSNSSGIVAPEDKPRADERVPAPRTPDRGTAR
jgi:lipopolysaccharide transport protein LptA